MAEKKTTEKKSKSTKSKSTKSKSTSSKIKLTFSPVASGAKEMRIPLKKKEFKEVNGRRVAVDVPLIDGLETTLIIRRDEVITVTKKQCDLLTEMGLVETEEEYKKRQAFVDNLKDQHPNKLSLAQMDGNTDGVLTMRDSQHKIYMDKLIRL